MGLPVLPQSPVEAGAVPPGHAVHVVAPAYGPETALEPQTLHWAAPGAADAVPTGQDAQVTLPGALAKVPAAHSEHCAWPGAAPIEPAQSPLDST